MLLSISVFLYPTESSLLSILFVEMDDESALGPFMC